MSNWLKEVVKNLLVYQHRCFVVGDTVFMFRRSDYLVLDLSTCRFTANWIECKCGPDGWFRILPEEVFEFIPFLTQRANIEGLNMKKNEFTCIIRHMNQITFPKEILKRLGLEDPCYGITVTFELKNVVLRDGTMIPLEEIEKRLNHLEVK